MFSLSQVFVLVVGANNTLEQREADLREVIENDVSHFTAHIRERFPDAELVELVTPKATVDHIKDEINKFSHHIADQGTKESLFIFYYTGHGVAMHEALGLGKLLTTSTLLTDDAKYENSLFKGGLKIGTRGMEDTLLGMIESIKTRKIIILDSCYGSVNKDNINQYYKGKKVVKLSYNSESPSIIEKKEDLLPNDCWIISACDILNTAGANKKGSYFTNAFLETVSRGHAYEPTNVGQWLMDDKIALDKADEIGLDLAIKEVNRKLEQLGLFQTAQIISPANKTVQIIKFPRLLDDHLPQKHHFSEIMGFTHPLVPKDILREDKVDIVKESLNNQDITTLIIHGPKLSGKTIIVASACQGLCYTQRDVDNNGISPKNTRPMAWVTLDMGMTAGYILPFICYHMDPSPDGAESRMSALSDSLDDNLDKEDPTNKFSDVIDLIEKVSGVVVIDNAELLIGDKVQLNTKKLVQCLIKDTKKGLIVLICNNYEGLCKTFDDLSSNSHCQNIEIKIISTNEAQKFLSREVSNWAGKLYKGGFTVADLRQAKYLLQKDSQLNLRKPFQIWKNVILELKLNGIEEYALFVSLFKGTNSVNMLKNVFQNEAFVQPLKMLNDIGILIYEKDHVRIHEEIALRIIKKFGHKYSHKIKEWHKRIAEEYGNNARTNLHLCQIKEAEQHYDSVGEYIQFAELFQDRKISFELKNWGYSECYGNWLRQLYHKKLITYKGSRKSINYERLKVGILLLELERHELNFSRLDNLAELNQFCQTADALQKARFNRTVGEMFLARRDYSEAQKYFNESVKEIQSYLSGESETNNWEKFIEGSIEKSRIFLRIVELFIYRGQPNSALLSLNKHKEEITRFFNDCGEKLTYPDNRLDNAVISNLCHQLAVVFSLEASAYIQEHSYEKAKKAASECIKYSIFCRSYSTGDVLGRIIGHILYSTAISKLQEPRREEARWHIEKAITLLKRRLLRETWWFTSAQLSILLLEQFHEGINAFTGGYSRLDSTVIPKIDNGAWDRSMLSPSYANNLLWANHKLGIEYNNYDFHALYTLSDKDFYEDLKLQRSNLTDSWREAELLCARASLCRKEVKKRISEENGYTEPFDNSSIINEANFCIYLGYALARMNNYILLMAELLREASCIFRISDNIGSYEMAAKLIIDSIEITQLSDSNALLCERLNEFASMIDTRNPWSKLDEVTQQLRLLCVLYKIQELSDQDCILNESNFDKIKKVESKEVLGKLRQGEQLAVAVKSQWNQIFKHHNYGEKIVGLNTMNDIRILGIEASTINRRSVYRTV